MNLPRRLFLAVPAGFLAPPVTAAAEDRLESLLAAIGGRATWAALTGKRNDSQQNRVERAHRGARRREHRLHATARAHRTRAPGLWLARALDGERHWRLARDGTLGPIPEPTLQEDRRWYAGHVHRTLHRLAARDPLLTVGTPPDAHGGSGTSERRLEVFASGRRLAWFDLDRRGEPYAFGAHDDTSGAICVPWAFGIQGLRHPVWVAQRDGSWRAWLRHLELNPTWTPGLFSQPGGG